MKKPKISLDKDKLQQFFLLHIEKILLGIIICLMLLVVWRGYSLPAFKELTPQALVDKSNNAKQYIDNPTRWDEIKEPRLIKAPLNVVEGVLKVQKPSDPLAYMLVNTWSRPDFPKLSPREDPELFAPLNLIVRPVMGAIASYPRNEAEFVDPLFPSMTDDERRAKQKKAAADKKKKDKEESKLGGGGGMPGEGMPTRKGKKSKTPAPGEESAPGPRGSMAGGYGGEYGGMGGMLGDRYPESTMVGYIPQDASNTIARYMPSITVLAVVPIQRQSEEYDKKLSESLDYDPRRDTPLYIDFRVRRADVTDLDPTAPVPDNLWRDIATPEGAFKEMNGDAEKGVAGLYAGFPAEVVDPTYLPYTMNPNFPMHPAPPYLQRDLWDLLTHPDVPLASFQTGYGEMAATAGGPTTAGGDDDAPLARSGVGGVGGMPGGGEGGPGMMRGPGMMPGGPGGMPGGGSMRGPMGSGMPGGGMPGGFRPGGYGRGGEESAGGYGNANAQTYTPPKYQLIRYTDTHVEPGRKYRYRIRVRLNDPNHPDLTYYQSPSTASLHKSVRDRLAPIDEADKAKGKDQNGFPIRTYWRWSPWSEPSPAAELPAPGRVYALKVLPPAPQKIRNVDVTVNDPQAHAIAVMFDPAKGADIPAENDKVYRGSVLNFTATEPPKLIHPVSKEVVEFPKDQRTKYDISTNVMVADMMGGERMKSVSGLPQPLSALGEFLVMDPEGNLHVQNEAQDNEQIRRYTVPKEDKKAKTTTDPSGLTGDAPGGRPARSRD
jgi:hypothetical protein